MVDFAKASKSEIKQKSQKIQIGNRLAAEIAKKKKGKDRNTIGGEAERRKKKN